MRPSLRSNRRDDFRSLEILAGARAVLDLVAVTIGER